MRCPNCGGYGIKVTRSLNSVKTIERTRKCCECGYIFHSSESIVSSSSRINLLVNAYTREVGSNEEILLPDLINGAEASFITPNEYQKKCLRTANRKLSHDKQLANGLMGLNGEAGEAIDLLKKHLFQGHDLDEEHMAKELGDVAWYLAISAYALGYELEDILKMNIAKLQARYPDKFDPKLSINRKDDDI